MEDSTPAGNQDGPGADARFHTPTGITVSPICNVVVVDRHNHALRLVSKACAASTLAGGGGAGLAHGQGAAARFHWPHGVVATATGDYVMTDFHNHAVRVVTPDGAVRGVRGVCLQTTQPNWKERKSRSPGVWPRQNGKTPCPVRLFISLGMRVALSTS